MDIKSELLKLKSQKLSIMIKLAEILPLKFIAQK